MYVRITDPGDERLVDYTQLTDVALRRVREPAEGLYMAESSSVIARALAAGHRPRSYLMAEKWLADLEPLIAEHPAPVYLAEPDVLRAITGFHLHRGALAAMHRPVLPPVDQVVTGARRVVILEDLVDHTNVGAAFRSCAALGIDAVLVTPRCADPLYRRAVRVSMGTVFQIPWTRIDSWPGGMAQLRAAGFTIAALALDAGAVALNEWTRQLPDRIALVFGTEGDGLSRRTVEGADLTVRIPMSGGVDSLNVSASLAVVAWATGLGMPG